MLFSVLLGGNGLAADAPHRIPKPAQPPFQHRAVHHRRGDFHPTVIHFPNLLVFGQRRFPQVKTGIVFDVKLQPDAAPLAKPKPSIGVVFLQVEAARALEGECRDLGLADAVQGQAAFVVKSSKRHTRFRRNT